MVLGILCVIVFLPSIVSAGTFDVQRHAYYNPDGTYTLTHSYGEAGLISYSDALNSENGFDISFRFIISEGSIKDDADGMAAVFSPSMGIVGGGGPELGAPSGKDIYVVEMDTFFGDESHDAPGDPEYMHIGITKGSFENHIIYKRCDALTDRNWHTLRVTYSAKVMTVFLDGNKYISQALSLPKTCYFSISGGTGDYYSVQEVREISVKQMAQQKNNIADSTVTLSTTKYTYNGKAKKPTPTVKLNGKTLKAGTDYTVSYSNNTNPGTASVTITGKGSYTGTKKVTFTIVSSTLPAPQNVKAVLTSSNSVKITWSKVSGAKNYTVYGKSGNGSYKKIKTASGTSVTISSLSAGKKYTYYVKAVNSKGKEGGKSSEVSVTAVSNTVTGLTVEKKTSTKVRVSWNKAAGASGYDVSVSTSESGTKIEGSTSASKCYKDFLIPPGVKIVRYVKVRPWAKVGVLKIYGKWSDVVRFSTETWAQRMGAFKNDPRWAVNGNSWGSDQKPVLSNYGSKSCLAYVNDFVAYVYGRRNVKSDKRDKKRPDCTADDKATDKNIQNIKAGDVVAFYNSKGGKHYFVVISYDKSTGKMYTMEGNASHKIRVGETHYQIKDGKLQENWPSKGKDNWSNRTFRWTKHFDSWKAD